MQIINDKMEFEVGKYYWITCIEHTNKYVKCKNIFIPIIDLYHKDPQFGVDFFHYHIDARFTNKFIDDAFRITREGKTNDVVDWRSGNYTWQGVRKVKKLRKCRRLETGLETKRIRADDKYFIWRKSMIGKSCKGKKCPHLGTTMINVNGKLFCPLHNLVGCPEKEIIIDCT